MPSKFNLCSPPLLFTKSWPLTYPIELIKPLIKYGGAICGEEGKMQKGGVRI
jgi:hypothetical protein